MILIGLGSNLTTGEFSSSKAILDAAIAALNDHGINVLKCSRFYETEPVPKSDQPWFVNAVISVKTDFNAHELLKKMHNIEHNLGRVRRNRWEARIIDLDLLCFSNIILPSPDEWGEVASKMTSTEVIIPHARMHERDFVLIPLADISTEWMHPILNKNVTTMLKEQKSSGIVRLL
ncbi:MAG: 2-amino-4-hydroxy-6-hydroxymethyldihydropteridine diphosphokinase [Emcibacteraceae bacterium]|nr:2-amino-4-hydroxy-6-hydroxymethyldihydropteridine diphosphokinase [Emcibacteraceae bacterium]